MTDEPADEPVPRISCLHPALFLTTVRNAAIVACVVGAVLTVCSVVLSGARDRVNWGCCARNQMQVGLGLRAYAQDHDGFLPPADAWCDQVYPYIKNTDVYRCPIRGDARCGFWLNEALIEVDLDTVTNQDKLVLTFEGPGGWNLVGGPADFLTPHRGMGTALLLDGRWTLLDDALRPTDEHRLPGTWHPEFHGTRPDR